MRPRLLSWGGTILYYGRCSWYCIKTCPWASIVALILFMFFKSSALLVVWAQAESVALLAGASTDAGMLASLLVTFCTFSVFYKFRGYMTLSVNSIIGNTVTIVCMKQIMRACSLLPLQSLDTEETSTKIKRARDKAEDFQGDVMMFADTLSGAVSLVVFVVTIASYNTGYIYLIAVILMVFCKKIFSLIFTEKETALKVSQTNTERKCEYYFNLQTERASASELKVDNLYPFFTGKWESTNNRMIAERLSLSRWNMCRTALMGGISELIFAAFVILLVYQVVYSSMTIQDYVYCLYIGDKTLAFRRNLKVNLLN